MNKEIKEKWVAALRSGEYKQGKYKLLKVSTIDDSRQYCCLGVLCDLYLKDNNREWEDGTTCEDSQDFLPQEVINYADLNSRNPQLFHATFGTHNISEYNDNYGFTFSDIADLIEEQL